MRPNINGSNDTAEVEEIERADEVAEVIHPGKTNLRGKNDAIK